MANVGSRIHTLETLDSTQVGGNEPQVITGGRAHGADGGRVIEPESHRRLSMHTVLLALGGCLLIWFARPADSRWGSQQIRVLMAIAGLSSPAGAVMAVPFAISWRIARRRADLVSASVLAVGMFVWCAPSPGSDWPLSANCAARL